MFSFLSNANDDKKNLRNNLPTFYAANHGDQKNLIAPRRQARKERPLFISPNLGALCAFARDTFYRLLLDPKIPNIFG
jgi:hypothetical protein